MRYPGLLLPLILLAACCPEQPRRYDWVILLAETDKGDEQIQRRLDTLALRRWKVVEDDDTQARTDIIHLWKFMLKEEARVEQLELERLGFRFEAKRH